MKTAAALCAAALMLGAGPLWAQDSPPPQQQQQQPAPEAAPPPKSAERLPPAPRGRHGRESPSLKFHTDDAKLEIECGPEESLKDCTEIAVDFFRRIQKND